MRLPPGPGPLAAVSPGAIPGLVAGFDEGCFWRLSAVAGRTFRVTFRADPSRTQSQGHSAKPNIPGAIPASANGVRRLQSHPSSHNGVQSQGQSRGYSVAIPLPVRGLLSFWKICLGISGDFLGIFPPDVSNR